MRIIAGRLGGRNFESPRGHRTHPMSDKTRGALFNALGDINGLSVLDAFAGSGALGFEAISRGAARVLAIERDKNAQQAIAASSRQLGIGPSSFKLVKANAAGWLNTTASTGTDEMFDLVLLDPPFDDLQPALLAKLSQRAKLGGIVVMSLPPAGKVHLPDGFERIGTKSYSDNQLVFHRRNA